ncbi:MAG TPA: YgcG family protein [Stenotrophobium sp.]|jgi:uncharacterized protein|nr:YgcG family protein [Stenotrophobium sp.]
MSVVTRCGFAGLLVLLAALCLPQLARADDVAVPTYGARVTDLTGTLTHQQVAALEQKLAAFEQQKGSQIAVLMVPTTQPETIDQYSIRVVDAWKLGRKKIDDGALLLIAKNDHKVRIEVGYGLEGVLPDAIANRIIDEIIAPHFKQGDFYGGINDGILHMMGVIQGEPLPPPPAQGASAQGGHGNSMLGALMLPFFILIAIGQVLRRLLGTGPASAVVGAGTGLAAFFILGSLALAAGVGVIAIIFALGMYSGATGGMFMGGGFGGGGFGGGGFGGGGGFSGGGGGGFGGGGASGSW